MLKPRIKIVIAEYETNVSKFVRKEAAEKLGITPQYLSDIIGGRKLKVDPEILFGLAHLLMCKVDDLYEYKEDEHGRNNN